MREIKLTQEKVALVDDEDFERLKKFKWQAEKSRNTFYAKCRERNSPRITIRMHRLIMNCEPGQQIDHIDGDGLNNQKENLRIVTNRGNAQNKHIKKSSRFPGVRFKANRNRWYAEIRINGKVTYLGSFLTEEAAFNRYKEECLKIE